MKIIRHQTANALLNRAGVFLLRAEAENNLILGLCRGRVEADDDAADTAWLLTIEQDGAPIGVAFMERHNLIVTRMPTSALDALVEYLIASAAPVPGVIGPSAQAAVFAEAWSSRTQQAARLHMKQRIHDCKQVDTVPVATGGLRPAESEDRQLLVEWFRAFYVAVAAHEFLDRCDETVDRVIANKSVFLWDDNGPVSCAACSRETTNGVAITFVYTPPEHRGRGYATSSVATLTQRLLDFGRAFCCLYTDLANPTSNGIYRRIGYRPVCDAEVWKFYRSDRFR